MPTTTNDFRRTRSALRFTTFDAPTTGSIFFVHAGTGSSTGGYNPDAPAATIDQAINLCTADKGDRIYVMPGHAETIAAAAGIDADVSGISIIGIPNGSQKPTITLATATTADIDIDAANVKISGLRFVSGIDDLAVMLDVNFGNFTLEDCEFHGPATFECLNFINLATTKDDFYIRRCVFRQDADPTGTDGAADTGAIFLVDSENIFIDDCGFYGSFETALIHNRTTACKNLWVRNCFGVQALSGAEPFQLVAAANGGTVGGGFITPAEAAVTEATLVGTIGDGFFILGGTTFGNDGAAGGQGGIVPATAS